RFSTGCRNKLDFRPRYRRTCRIVDRPADLARIDHRTAVVFDFEINTSRVRTLYPVTTNGHRHRKVISGVEFLVRPGAMNHELPRIPTHAVDPQFRVPCVAKP